MALPDLLRKLCKLNERIRHKVNSNLVPYVVLYTLRDIIVPLGTLLLSTAQEYK